MEIDIKPTLERFGRAKYYQIKEALPWLDSALEEGNAELAFALCNRISKAVGGIEDAATMQVDPTITDVEGL